MQTIQCRTNTAGELVEVNVIDLDMRVCVYGVVVHEGKILISPQWSKNGFDFPGGHIDKGENHLDALVREVREETGLNILVGNPIAVTTTFYKHYKRGPAHYTLIHYSGEVIGGEISTDGFDEGEQSYARMAKFVTLDELKSMKYESEQSPLPIIIAHLETLV